MGVYVMSMVGAHMLYCYVLFALTCCTKILYCVVQLNSGYDRKELCCLRNTFHVGLD